MKNKLLILLLIITLAIPVPLSYANTSPTPNYIDTSINKKTENNPNLPGLLPEFASVAGVVYNSEKSQRLQQIIEKSQDNSLNRMRKQNQYVFSKNDLEHLILSGSTEEDIYIADQLANEWLVTPLELIQRKKIENQSWEEVETRLKQEKNNRLQLLLLQNPEAESIFSGQKINTAEKIEVLESSSSNNFLEQTLNELKSTSISIPLNTQNEQSVIESVYIDQNLLDGSSDPLNQALVASTYSQDITGIFNGLITQVQINQTNKPQYADQSGSSEHIDPSSGKLTWQETEISLPGRDGLDLNIGVIHNSNYAYTYQETYGITGNLKKANYLLSRYDLGMGWGFQFPSIQLADGGYLYYHKGDGAVYRIDFSASVAPDNYTHLIGYQGKDVKLLQDTQGLFSNGQASSAYYLEYADKKESILQLMVVFLELLIDTEIRLRFNILIVKPMTTKSIRLFHP